MDKLYRKSPEEIERILPDNAILWILSADHDTGILGEEAPQEITSICLAQRLIELCFNSSVWKLSPNGWIIWDALLRRRRN